MAVPTRDPTHQLGSTADDIAFLDVAALNVAYRGGALSPVDVARVQLYRSSR
jgi:hypothetical protein